MESIRILQDTYEKLYAITPEIGNKLESEFKALSNDWRSYYVDSLLRKKGVYKKWTHLYEIDSYYLLKIMGRNWTMFSKKSDPDFFTEENRNLFVNRKKEFSLISIRNKVSHPEQWNYSETVYHEWTRSLETAAERLGTSMSELLYNLHKDEKEKILKYIFEHSTNITMKSPEFKLLSKKTQETIIRTKGRLEEQTTAAGIMSLFEDSYFLGKGKSVREELNLHHLPTFDEILDDVKKLYYGF